MSDPGVSARFATCGRCGREEDLDGPTLPDTWTAAIAADANSGRPHTAVILCGRCSTDHGAFLAGAQLQPDDDTLAAARAAAITTTPAAPAAVDLGPAVETAMTGQEAAPAAASPAASVIPDDYVPPAAGEAEEAS